MNLAVLAANKKQNRKRIDFANLFFVIAVLFILSRIFFWGTYKVEGHSMDPTLKGGNHLVAINYFTPERGDLVTAKEDDRVIIKRVIGLPGETVKFVDNQTYICNEEVEESTVKAKNGNSCFKLDESYLKLGAETIPQEWWDEFEIKGWYFAMGDNRGHTTDSLHCFSHQCYRGANYVVPNNYMIGRVMFRVFPKAQMF